MYVFAKLLLRIACYQNVVDATFTGVSLPVEKKFYNSSQFDCNLTKLPMRSVCIEVLQIKYLWKLLFSCVCVSAHKIHTCIERIKV